MNNILRHYTIIGGYSQRPIAYSEEDTCRNISRTFCGDKWWWVQFTTADYGSVLRKISVDHSRNINPDETVYFRYNKFVVGADDGVEVVAGTSCCNKRMRIVVTDIDGNNEEFTAKSYNYGVALTTAGNLTKTVFWCILGVVIFVVLLIVSGSIWYHVRNKCNGHCN